MLGSIATDDGSVQILYYQFVGSASNVGGQSIALQLFINGSAVASSLVTETATAGVHAGSVAVSTDGGYTAGDVLTVRLTPSATLTAALTSIMVALG